MRYAGLVKNDFSAGEGTCVTFYTQGCPHRCEGCHNPETWNFEGGKEFTPDVFTKIFQAIVANDLERNFCIMGGEPLCEDNLFLTNLVITEVRKKFPNIKIYVWTGYIIEDIKKSSISHMKSILNQIDCLIDGPFIEAEKDLTLKMRGSRNQRILLKGVDF